MVTAGQYDRFERAYQATADPWCLASSDYEQRRFDLTVAALPRRRYRRAFEPGCSLGELTARLAERCDEVVAWDVAPTAAAAAARRFAAVPGVQVGRGVVPTAWPEGRFDLVVVAEIGYYLSAGELGELARRVQGSLVPGGAVVAVHWRGVADDQLQHGDEVHERLGAAFGEAPRGSYVEAELRLDVWELG